MPFSPAWLLEASDYYALENTEEDDPGKRDTMCSVLKKSATPIFLFFERIPWKLWDTRENFLPEPGCYAENNGKAHT